MTVTGLLPLTSVRDAAAAALAPAADDDPAVYVDAVDAIVPPALLLWDWADPWIAPAQTIGAIGACQWEARFQVTCVTGRLEPGAGLDELERLVTHVVDRLAGDAYPWPLDQVTAPLQRDLGGVAYLAANVVYVVPTTLRKDG